MKHTILKYFTLLILLCFVPAWASSDRILEESSFVSPTELFVLDHGPEEIEAGFNLNSVSLKFKKLFDKAQANEKLGFFGYHGSSRDFRIYQDIIRIGIEEILELPIREDFQFLRVPGSAMYDLEGVNDFLSLFPSVFDLNSEQQAKLLSMQIALYSECLEYSSGSCPTEYFTKNFSLTTVNYVTKLTEFFNLLGLDPANINIVFHVARNALPSDRGVLMQFFDRSHYNFLDTQAYPSFPLGIPYNLSMLPSDFILNRHFQLDHYTQKNGSIFRNCA